MHEWISDRKTTCSTFMWHRTQKSGTSRLYWKWRFKSEDNQNIIWYQCEVRWYDVSKILSHYIEKFFHPCLHIFESPYFHVRSCACLYLMSKWTQFTDLYCWEVSDLVVEGLMYKTCMFLWANVFLIPHSTLIKLFRFVTHCRYPRRMQ